MIITQGPYDLLLTQKTIKKEEKNSCYRCAALYEKPFPKVTMT